MIRTVAVAAVLLMALCACDFSQYDFRTDKSISITAPKARSDVDLPITVNWSDHKVPSDLRVAPKDSAANYYAVFVDQAPIRPGNTVDSVLDRDDSCRRSPTCVLPKYLESHGVFLTDHPSLTLDSLNDRRSNGHGKDSHELTIVRIHGDRRIGEAAFRLTFFVRR